MSNNTSESTLCLQANDPNLNQNPATHLTECEEYERASDSNEQVAGVNKEKLHEDEDESEDDSEDKDDSEDDSEDKDDSEDEDDSEDDSEDEDEDEDGEGKPELSLFSFTENSDLYAISVDGVPICYVKDEETARNRTWELARLYLSRKTLSGWQTRFVKISRNELHLLGSYRFFLIAYDKVLLRV